MSFISTFSSRLSSVRNWISLHKIISALIAIIIIGVGWWVHGKLTSTAGETRYVLGTVASSTIVASVSASGQVAATDSIDLKAKISGEITWIGVQAGDKVSAGQAIATIDSATAHEQVTQAESSLATSKLQYQKDTAQAPIDFQKAQDDLTQAQSDLSDDYVNTFNSLSSAYLDLPTVVTGTQNALYGYDMSSNKSQWNVDVLVNLFQHDEDKAKATQFATTAKNDYQTARTAYDTALETYKTTSRTSTGDTLESLLSQSTDMTTAVAQAVQSELNFLNTITDLAQKNNTSLPAYFNTLATNARSYLSTANSDQNTLLAQKKTLQTAKQTITTDQHTLDLLKVGNAVGTDPISLQISANNIASAEANLAQLKANLADYTVVAPFSGTISTVALKKGDTSSGTIASLITPQQIAQLSMNEVDAAKVQLGQKATLTFDAIEGLTLTGKVVELDTVGTVSQGVVSYTVKIAFDTQDIRVKPGMTVNANIITAVKQNVLVVPSSAVKTANGSSYVLAFVPPLSDSGTSSGVTSKTVPQQIPVVTGISDDTNIEIVSGLSAGQQIVMRTTTAAATAATSAARTTTNGRPGGGFGGIRLGG